jgi:hypothetical protein
MLIYLCICLCVCLCLPVSYPPSPIHSLCPSVCELLAHLSIPISLCVYTTYLLLAIPGVEVMTLCGKETAWPRSLTESYCHSVYTATSLRKYFPWISSSAVSYRLSIQLIPRKILKRLLNRDQKCFDGSLYKVNRTHYGEIMVSRSVRPSVLLLASDTFFCKLILIF